MIESTPFLYEDHCPPPELYNYPRRRRGSTDSNSSTSSWGSDIATRGCECVSHSKDELEVADWLLHADEIDWAVRPRPPPSGPQTPPSHPPFSFHNIPGSLFLHLLYALFLHWGLFPSHPVRPRAAAPKPAVVKPPLKKEALYNYLGKRDYSVRPDGTRMRIGISESYFLVDDTEYVIAPRPGTADEEVRIAVTNDFSEEKIQTQTHTPDFLRIYRVPLDSRIVFGYACNNHKLVGHEIRKPYDSFDHVSIVRQSYVSWDLGPRDQTWMLVGRSARAITAVLERCDRRKPPFATRMKQLFLKACYKIFAPWLPKWVLY